MKPIDCSRAERLLADSSADELMFAADLAALDQHLARCAACRVLRGAHESLRRDLRELAKSSATAAPPARVEVHLLRALRATRRRRMVRWGGTAAAVFAVGLALGLLRAPRPPAEPAETSPAPRVSEFILLDSGGPAEILDRGRLLRVTLPSSAPAYLGFPEIPALEGRGIDADVFIGDDGVARAVRFVY